MLYRLLQEKRLFISLTKFCTLLLKQEMSNVHKSYGCCADNCSTILLEASSVGGKTQTNATLTLIRYVTLCSEYWWLKTHVCSRWWEMMFQCSLLYKMFILIHLKRKEHWKKLGIKNVIAGRQRGWLRNATFLALYCKWEPACWFPDCPDPNNHTKSILIPTLFSLLAQISYYVILVS